jgi:hypothetical protein
VALQNRVSGVRNGALRTLEIWTPQSWPAEVREVLTAALWCEPRASVRRNIRALLEKTSPPAAEVAD